MKWLLKSFIIALFISLILQPFTVRSEDEPLTDMLRETFQKEYFSIGLLLQTVADFQPERTLPGYNGFNISNFRLKIYGELDKKIGYFVQASFVNSPGLLDAKLYYRFSNQLTVDGGLFKAPFSKEYLTGADAIDFVNRSRIVTVLAPGRQIGLQARGRLDSGIPVDYNLGMFNGNGYATNANDNNDFLYTARLTVFPISFSKESISQLEIGANMMTSMDYLSRISPLLNPFVYDVLLFSGKRMIYGADLRYTNGDFLLAGEYLKGDFDGDLYFLAADTSIGSVTPDGYHLTAGYMLTQNLQILGRWDRFKAHSGADNTDWVLIGLNFWPSEVGELQFNYVIDTGNSAIKYHQVLLNAQIAF